MTSPAQASTNKLALTSAKQPSPQKRVPSAVKDFEQFSHCKCLSSNDYGFAIPLKQQANHSACYRQTTLPGILLEVVCAFSQNGYGAKMAADGVIARFYISV